MANEKEKLEIKKKPQEVKKEELDKVAGGDTDTCLPGVKFDTTSSCPGMCNDKI